jgi:FixJ family two-component response regulator
MGTKILPKQLASEIPIKIEKTDMPIEKNSEKVDVVIIDDDKMLLNSFICLFGSRDKMVDTYLSPHRFLESVSQYAKDTKILMDNDMASGINGIELAQKLHEMGYTQLYLHSGLDFEKKDVPNYLTIVRKGDFDNFNKLFGLSRD